MMAGRKSTLNWAVHISVAALVLLWLFPTMGLFVSSFRTTDQIASSGWWNAMFAVERNIQLRTAPDTEQTTRNGIFVIEGRLFGEDSQADIRSWGVSSRDVNAYAPGEVVELRKGGTISVAADGTYMYSHEERISSRRGQRVFVRASLPPEFTFGNYHNALFNPKNVEGMGRAFLNTFTVTIPATIIPILIAAFAAYALSWMEFPGRVLIITAIVGLLVVPLQLALIPLLKLHLWAGIGKGYIGVWLAHTGFGMPLAIYLLRNYISRLPRDIIENARIDGASEFQIFLRLVLPLSLPALASFSIFQFLWTWNDLLVAKVFLINADGETDILTSRLVELLGTRGGNWEVLATSAFISIAVPLAVFFAMQKYLVRGLLAGSVK